MKTLNVDLGERTYPIHIGHGLIESDLLGSVIRGRQLLLVTDETVAPLYLERVLSNLTAFEVATVTLPDGENHKNVETLDPDLFGSINQAILAKCDYGRFGRWCCG